MDRGSFLLICVAGGNESNQIKKKQKKQKTKQTRPTRATHSTGVERNEVRLLIQTESDVDERRCISCIINAAWSLRRPLDIINSSAVDRICHPLNNNNNNNNNNNRVSENGSFGRCVFVLFGYSIFFLLFFVFFFVSPASIKKKTNVVLLVLFGRLVVVKRYIKKHKNKRRSPTGLRSISMIKKNGKI